jgi:hypothetical protein
MRLAELASSGTIALVDAGVVRDMASALTGLWVPAAEDYPERAEELVAAARVRLYGDRERSGWLLLTTRQARDAALRRGDADWSVGMIPAAEDLEEAPPPAEIDALIALYRREEKLDAESARTLATALLFEPIGLVITRLPRAMRHQRAGDLPGRLEIVDPFEAVERLEIAPDEKPRRPPPNRAEDGHEWWVPD